MKNRTREAEGPIFTPSPSDVQDLIAAIAKIERKERTQAASLPLTPKDESPPPRSSPTRQNWRLSKTLDSLANLCVSETNHEVIATALRVNDNARSIELIIASNTNVQDSTVAHLQEIWKTLRRISTLSHKYRPLDPEADTPPRNVDNAQVSDLSSKLVQLCLEFSFSRLQKRINKNFHHFSAIDANNSDPECPFQIVRRWVNVLEKVFTRDNGARIGKPRHDDTGAWATLWVYLKSTKRAIDTFFDDEGFRAEDVAGAESYLRKVVSFVNDIEVLAKVANSPQCQRLFTFTFKVTPLRGPVAKAISVPQTPKEWETVFEKALLIRNECNHGEEEDYLIDVERIEEDTAYMAQKAIQQDIVIHCEVRILLHICEIENENPNIPKAYTYIGVSKLSCRGCRAFFISFNRVHKTGFVTKGSHNKSYWPWQFPPSFPNSDSVLSRTYRFIAKRWVDFYDGYVEGQVLWAQDSAAQTSTSGSHGPDNTLDSTKQTGTSGSPHPANQDDYLDVDSIAERWGLV